MDILITITYLDSTHPLSENFIQKLEEIIRKNSAFAFVKEQNASFILSIQEAIDALNDELDEAYDENNVIIGLSCVTLRLFVVFNFHENKRIIYDLNNLVSRIIVYTREEVTNKIKESSFFKSRYMDSDDESDDELSGESTDSYFFEESSPCSRKHKKESSDDEGVEQEKSSFEVLSFENELAVSGDEIKRAEVLQDEFLEYLKGRDSEEVKRLINCFYLENRLKKVEENLHLKIPLNLVIEQLNLRNTFCYVDCLNHVFIFNVLYPNFIFIEKFFFQPLKNYIDLVERRVPVTSSFSQYIERQSLLDEEEKQNFIKYFVKFWPFPFVNKVGDKTYFIPTIPPDKSPKFFSSKCLSRFFVTGVPLTGNSKNAIVIAKKVPNEKKEEANLAPKNQYRHFLKFGIDNDIQMIFNGVCYEEALRILLPHSLQPKARYITINKSRIFCASTSKEVIGFKTLSEYVAGLDEIKKRGFLEKAFNGEIENFAELLVYALYFRDIDNSNNNFGVVEGDGKIIAVRIDGECAFWQETYPAITSELLDGLPRLNVNGIGIHSMYNWLDDIINRKKQSQETSLLTVDKQASVNFKYQVNKALLKVILMDELFLIRLPGIKANLKNLNLLMHSRGAFMVACKQNESFCAYIASEAAGEDVESYLTQLMSVRISHKQLFIPVDTQEKFVQNYRNIFLKTQEFFSMEDVVTGAPQRLHDAPTK